MVMWTCSRCDSELRPSMKDVGATRQFNDGLSVDISGGYGMFLDLCFQMGEDGEQVYPKGVIELDLCHDCCVALMKFMNLSVEEFKGGHPGERINISDIHAKRPCCEYGWAPVYKEGEWVGTMSGDGTVAWHDNGPEVSDDRK